MDILINIWEYFVTNILTKPQYFVGFMVFFGYLLLRKQWYDILAGTIKAIVGFMILQVGSGGLVVNFRPVLVGLKDKFQLDAMVIDPYFGQNAIDSGVEEVFGRTFGDVMLLLLVAFIVNIIVVRFSKYTKLRALFTTGHVQVQQAATAFWLILFALPALDNTLVLVVMAVVLGLYWAVGSNLTVEPTQELTEGAGFAIAHQQMFAIWATSKISERIGKKGGDSARKMEDVELPGFMSIFNENLVSTALLMLVFFGAILLILGQDYLITAGFMAEGDSFLFYILGVCLKFSVYLTILQLGVRTFVTELTASFQGIADKLLPGAVPGVDCAVAYGFGSPNAIPVGFIAGAAGQFLAIIGLIVFKSPTIVIAGFVPVFFDNATLAVYANNKGGFRAAVIVPFIAGIIQVLGSAAIATWVGMSAYGGYLGMTDWATVWPVITVVLKFLGVIGIILIVVVMVAIPQLQYRANPEGYFKCTEDYEEYARLKAEKEAAK